MEKYEFRIANDWKFRKEIVNIELLSVHYEHGLCFWFTILGISFIWE